MDTDKMVKVYIKMRDKRDEIKRAYEEEDRAIADQMDLIARELLELCKTAGADSLRTQSGTVMRGVRTRYWTSDWESMYKVIKENDAPYLLEQRISQGNMKRWLEDNPDKLPPGLNVDSKYSVTVRRSS